MKQVKIDIFLVNVLLFLLPIIYIPGYGSYNILKYFFFGTISLVLTVFTVHKFVKDKSLLKSFFKSWYSYGLIAYLTSFFIVSMTSINKANSFFSSFQRTDGFFAVLFLSLFALSIYRIVATSVDKKKTIRKFLISSILGAIILSVFIIFSPDGLSVFEMDWLTNSRGGAMLGNSSVAASYILWNIFFTAILFVNSIKIKEKILWALSCFVLLCSPLFVNYQLILGKEKYTGLISFIGTARGATLGVLFGVVIMLSVWSSFQKNKIKKYLGVLMIIFILLSSVMTGISLLNKNSIIHEKFIENVGEARFAFWDSAVMGFKERPILGWGPNNFIYPFHKFFAPQLFLAQNNFEVIVDKTHNIFFETLVGGGILLVLSLVFLFVSIVFGLIKLVKTNKLLAIEASLLLGVFGGWLLQAQFVFESIASLSMLFLIGGIVYGMLTRNKEEKKQKTNHLSFESKLIFFAIVCLIIALFIYTIILPYKKDRMMYKIYDTHLPLRASLWKNLSGISPMGDSYDSIITFNNISKSYYQQEKNIRTWDLNKKEVVLKELDAIIEHLSNLIGRDNNNYDLILIASKISYVRMYIANDFSGPLLTMTQDFIQRAISLSPTDPQPNLLREQIERVD